MEVSRKSWPLGWTPTDDAFQGRVDGLPVFENLTMEEDGVITLTDGTKIVSNGPMASGITQIYSKVFNLNMLAPGAGWPNRAKVRYMSISNGTVVRNYGASFKSEVAYELQLLAGGPARATFGFARGWTLINLGNQHLKDNGIVQFPLGLPQPNAPGAFAKPPQVISMGNLFSGTFVDWDSAPIEGPPSPAYDKSADYIKWSVDTTSGRGIVGAGHTVFGTQFTEDTTAFGGVTGKDTPEDLFKIDVRLSDTSKLVQFRIEILLDPYASGGTTPDVTDYYWFEWSPQDTTTITGGISNSNSIPNELTAEQINSLVNAFPATQEFVGGFRNGLNVWNTLQAKRSQFNRVGTDPSKGWQNVKGYRLVAIGAAPLEILATGLQFQGGVGSSLIGTYKVIQVNAHNTGTFIDKSPISPESAEVTVYGSTITVTPNAVNAAIGNEIWLYLGGGTLDGYYRFAVIDTNTGAPASIDITMSETEMRALNERIDYYLENLPGDIVAIVDDFFDRTLYFTNDSMYPSYPDNPGGYDARFIYRVASNSGETILWAKKVSDSAVLVGTTKEIYAITGDGTEFDAGNGVVSLNFTKRPLGIDKPPVSDASAVRSGSIIYQAADGWRIMQGTNSAALDPMDRLELLYSTDKTYQEGLVNPVRRNFDNAVYTACVYHRDRLYISTELINVGRVLHIWDFTKQYWMQHTNVSHPQWNPFSLHLEEDGTILFGTDEFGDKNLREISRVNKLMDNSEKQIFKFRTVADNLNMPSQRKDTFSLQVEADTGSDMMAIMVRAYFNAGSPMEGILPQYSFNGRTIRTYNLAAFSNGTQGPPKRLSLTFTTAAGVTALRLFNYTFEVEPRPVQLTYLRIPPSNFNIQGRKRLMELPFVIDTLGSNVSVQPILDGGAFNAVTYGTTEKKTLNYVFPSDTTARDVGLIIQAQDDRVFEFYEMLAPRELELLPDQVVFKHIPYHNLGTSSRKRFIQYARVIDTRGFDVLFTPKVDDTTYPTEVWNSTRKCTKIYTFSGDATGIDIGGTLSSQVSQPFEDYGPNLEDCITEKLPAAAQFRTITSSNFGNANKKRIRTIPFVIDTRGSDVIYTPTVDCVPHPPTTFNTDCRKTVLHFFEQDVFGIDFGGTLSGTQDFEFYEMVAPLNVELLPMGRKWDQVGPFDLGRWTKLYWLYIRVLATGNAIKYIIYVEETTNKYEGTFQTIPGQDTQYPIRLPHYVAGKVFRIELISEDEFHRWTVKVQHSVQGATENKTLVLK